MSEEVEGIRFFLMIDCDRSIINQLHHELKAGGYEVTVPKPAQAVFAVSEEQVFEITFLGVGFPDTKGGCSWREFTVFWITRRCRWSKWPEI